MQVVQVFPCAPLKKQHYQVMGSAPLRCLCQDQEVEGLTAQTQGIQQQVGAGLSTSSSCGRAPAQERPQQ
jgi:hypothetical protein